MIIYNDLISDTETPVPLEFGEYCGLRMRAHYNPVSICECEFNFLRETIIKNGYTRAFECATAFGISALAIGLGLKETGGKLITMDAYVEEQHNSSRAYFDHDGTTYQNADGWRSVNYLIKKYELEDTVIPRVGWSPRDTEKVLSEEFGDDKLDFVFIDACHNPTSLKADIDILKDRLALNYMIAFHDNGPEYDESLEYFYKQGLTLHKCHCGGSGLEGFHTAFFHAK